MTIVLDVLDLLYWLDLVNQNDVWLQSTAVPLHGHIYKSADEDLQLPGCPVPVPPIASVHQLHPVHHLLTAERRHKLPSVLLVRG